MGRSSSRKIDVDASTFRCERRGPLRASDRPAPRVDRGHSPLVVAPATAAASGPGADTLAPCPLVRVPASSFVLGVRGVAAAAHLTLAPSSAGTGAGGGVSAPRP
ncbi:hypothetical protein QF037_007723 [Streptomyces canus]|nr:hypothetical protein [Streptomyces canus]